jgi:hypothetical protein
MRVKSNSHASAVDSDDSFTILSRKRPRRDRQESDTEQ